MKVTVVGLGYVGQPLALLAQKKGYEVVGVDVKPEAIEKAKRKGLTATKDFQKALKKSKIILVCVPTPVDSKFMPDLTQLKKACKTIAENLEKNQTAIIESTINPGVMEEIIKPMLETSGLKAGVDFYLAHCPERIDPGNKKWNVSNIPRVVGGINEKSTKKAANFYRKIIDAKITELSSIRAAEATKIMENSFRDINIAFVNEMAKSFDNLGIDITEVIKAASTKPFGYMPHYPGCGVGGHCIPVDPYYLIEEAKKKGFNHRFLILAREINNSMPDYTIQKTIEALNQIGKSVKNTRICVLGISYKKNVGDIRESPSIKIIEKLEKLGAKIETYDPYVKEKSTLKNLDQCLQYECLILATDHNVFKKLEGKKLKNVKVVIDGKNCLNKKQIKKNIIYKGIGN